MEMILYPEFPRPSFADSVIEACRAQGMDIRRRSFTMDLQTALSLVAIGEGACIVPASVGSAPRNGIRFLRFSPHLANTELALNHRIDEQGVHLKNFVRIAKAAEWRQNRGQPTRLNATRSFWYFGNVGDGEEIVVHVARDGDRVDSVLADRDGRRLGLSRATAPVVEIAER